jgi:RNA polymerase sigma-B factor
VVTSPEQLSSIDTGTFPAPTEPVPSEDRRALTARLLHQLAETTEETERLRLQDEVVVLNMGIARAIASRYRGKGIADEDLSQAAYMALLKAARGFDPSFEREFLSYAIPTIQGEVKRQFRDYGWMVRPPRPIQKLQSEVSNAMGDLTQTLGRSPRVSEVAQFLELPVDDVVEALSADGCYSPTSLDTPVGEDGSGTLGDLISADDHETSAAEARVMLAPAVQQLSDRDRRVLYLRFFKQHTQARIAEDIGVTQMQVCRILSRVLHELRGQID